MKFKKFTPLVTGVLLYGSSLLANAGIITFDEFELDVYYHDYNQASYNHDDFIFTTDVAFNSLGSLHPSYGTSAGMHASGVSANISLKRVDDRLFDISSIDLMIGLYNSYDGEIPVFFTGMKSNGETFNQVFELPYSINTYTTFSFNNSFTELKSLTWQQGAIYHSFDNVNLRPSIKAPEPSTLAIFALGMICLASRRFKKQ